MIETRRLHATEYSRLRDFGDGATPIPGASIAVVAEACGVPAGRMFVVFVAHVEGTWVGEAARSGIVGRRLLEQIEAEAAKEGLTKLMAYSTSGEHDSYLHRLGFERLPWTVWQKEVQCL
jgi:N-acetylglutamate synthase-like GNAT family acetyltransferase